MEIWFTADTHFGHKNIIEHCDRPFKTVEEMDEKILYSINERVHAHDILYHLGDFAWDIKRVPTYFGEIHCLNKHLILGNHDDRAICKRYFDSVEELLYYKFFHKKFVLCHYPFHSWRRNWFHLHGHSHGICPPKPGRIDIGWDVWKRPLNIDEVMGEFKKHPEMGSY